jgi:hypothetical protein
MPTPGKALAEGVAQDEIDTLEAGMFEGGPSEKVPALLYAQHWAETDGEAVPAVQEQTKRQYGGGNLSAEIALRMIRMENLLTLAACLSRRSPQRSDYIHPSGLRGIGATASE